MPEQKNKNISDHLANERTYLAWIRTGIGIMAFGFVVMKFSLFMKQLSSLLNKQLVIQQKGYSSIIGILLVAIGGLTILLAFLRYRKVGRQIEANEYQYSAPLITILTIIIFVVSLLLIAYLIESI